MALGSLEAIAFPENVSGMEDPTTSMDNQTTSGTEVLESTNERFVPRQCFAFLLPFGGKLMALFG